jgi:hypothetical protein
LASLNLSMQLSEIHFPVFKLGKQRPITEAGQAYYETNYIDTETASLSTVRRIVDDTGAPGSSLGLRRLNLKSQGVRLYKLGYAIYFLQDLIKMTVASAWYIDTTGKIFEYKKTKLCKLECFKIKDVLFNESGAAIVSVVGMGTRFKSLYPPSPDSRWVGLLKLPDGYVLYGFYNSPFKPSRRKV